MKEYKVVPGPTSISVSEGQTNAAFKHFENMMNQGAQKGWTFHSMQTITVNESVKVGCFTGPITRTSHLYMLIFEREV